MNSSRLRIKSPLILGLAMLAAAMLLAWTLSARALGRSDAPHPGGRDGAALRERLAVDLRAAVSLRAIAARGLVLVTAPAEVERERTALGASQAAVEQVLARLTAETRDAAAPERALVAQVRRAEDAYAAAARDLVGQALAGRLNEAIATMNAAGRLRLTSLLEAVDETIGVERTFARRRADAAAAGRASDRTVLSAACVVTAAAALTLGGLVALVITQPSRRAAPPSRPRFDEFGAVVAAQAATGSPRLVPLARMSGRRGRHGGDARPAAAAVSRTAEPAANSPWPPAVSLSRMAEKLRQIADGERAAGRRAPQGAETAAAAPDARRLADLVRAIDGIAFQTRMMAMSAASQAARGDERDRGFAALASEARSLARRSSEAARDLEALAGERVDAAFPDVAFAIRAAATPGPARIDPAAALEPGEPRAVCA
jgi:methyl-accepting chemotaxis protein-1 (serine sensor receptor)